MLYFFKGESGRVKMNSPNCNPRELVTNECDNRVELFYLFFFILVTGNKYELTGGDDDSIDQPNK